MICATLLVAALGAANGSAVIARVNGTEISSATVGRRIAAISDQRPARPEDALQQLVTEAILAAEGRRMGLAGSPDVAAAVDRKIREAAVAALLDEAVAGAKIDDATLRKSFHVTSDFASFDALFFGTRADAEAARQRLASGSTFAKEAPRAVVAQVSADPAAARPIMRGEIDPALAPLFDVAPGQIVGPVQARNGWVIAKLIRKEIGAEDQFASRRPALAANARNAARAQIRGHLAQQSRAKAAVTIDEPFLRSLDGLGATPEQLGHVAATVNGRPILYRDVLPRIRVLASASGHGASANVKLAVVSQVIDERALEDLAIERGHGKSPAVAALRPEIEQWAVASAAAEAIQAAAAAPSEDEIEAYYERNRARLGGSFSAALPAAAAGAAREKRLAALDARVTALRKRADITIDRGALAKAAPESQP